MAIIGNHRVHVTSEEEPNNATIPTHPVEDGVDIADYVQLEAQELSIEGDITGRGYKHVKKALLQARDSGERLTYVGKNTYRNMMIESIDFNSDESIANGEYFSATLREIRVAGKIDVEEPPETKETTDSGRKQTNNQPDERYHTIKQGDTYWGLAQKYGSSVKQLQNWNEWPAREIPIGVSARVK